MRHALELAKQELAGPDQDLLAHRIVQTFVVRRTDDVDAFCSLSSGRQRQQRAFPVVSRPSHPDSFTATNLPASPRAAPSARLGRDDSSHTG
jgi:hypothetical protein